MLSGFFLDTPFSSLSLNPCTEGWLACQTVCEWVCECVWGLNIIHDVLHLVPQVSWNRLQVPRHLVQDKCCSYRKWMDGWIGEAQGTLNNVPTQHTTHLSIHSSIFIHKVKETRPYIMSFASATAPHESWNNFITFIGIDFQSDSNSENK